MKEGLKIIDISQIVFALVILVIIMLFFLFLYPYHLFLQEQMQLFLFTSDYFLSYLQKPAWLSRYIGDFFTQFYYLRWGGALVLVSVFFVEFLLIRRVFYRIEKQENVWLLALLPVVAEWFLHTESGYRLSSTIGFILALLFFLFYSCIKRKGIAVVISLLLSPFLYSCIGNHLFLFAFLIVAYEINRKQFASWPFWIILFAGAGLYPVLFRDYYLLTTVQAFLFPGDKLVVFLPAAIMIMELVCCIFKAERSTYRHVRIEFVVLSIALLSLSVCPFVNANFTREKILSLDSETYFENWNRVLLKAERYTLRHPVVTYYTNLALSHRGELPERLLDFYQPFTDGLLLYAIPGKTPLEILYSGEAYFYLGDMNMAQHATMLSMISSSDHRSSRLVKRLTEINLINGDIPAAKKYLRMLDETLFHKKWAKNKWGLIESEDESLWLQEMRARIPTYDTLRTSYDGLASLTLLVNSNPMNKDALDYLLCFHLLNKDIKSFMNVYDHWFEGQKRPLPRLYAEAILIALAAEKASSKKIEKYGIPVSVTTEFISYTKMYEESAGSVEELREKYISTYWFYYHFAQMKKS